MRIQPANLFAIGSSVVVVAAICAGIVSIESPHEARLRRLDEQRVHDLQFVTLAVENYHRAHDRLPADLEQLVQPNSPGSLSLTDPESKTLYEYKALGQDSYELCAQFHTTLDAKSGDNRTNHFWDHGPSRTCFRIDSRLPSKPLE